MSERKHIMKKWVSQYSKTQVKMGRVFIKRLETF